MNGAQALIRTLDRLRRRHLLHEPGTSEMHFVAALDAVPEMHSVLALFEGVATGAADGYGRMADRPAATLLHLGPGLGNGLANLHNARKAHTPVVNIVGDHATYHKQYDAQLESDIETVARNVSSFIRWSAKTAEVGGDAADAVAAAFGPPGQVATLILPADVSWSEGGEPVGAEARRRPRRPSSDDAIRAIAAALRSGEPAVLLVGGTACREPALAARPRDRRHDRRQAPVRDVPGPHRARRRPRPGRPHRVPRRVRRRCSSTGCATSCSSTPRRRCRSSRIPTRRAGSRPDGCEVHTLAGPGRRRARGARGARRRARRAPPTRRAPAARAARAARPARSPRRPCARRSARCCPRARSSPTRATRRACSPPGATAGAPPHDWLCLTGGAIGQGLPGRGRRRGRVPRPPGDRARVRRQRDVHDAVAGGRWRAKASTSRRSSSTTARTPCSTWSSAASAPRPRARRAKAMLDIRRPDLDFVALAQGMGVPRDARQRPPRSSTSSSHARSRRRARRSSKRSCRRSSDDRGSMQS